MIPLILIVVAIFMIYASKKISEIIFFIEEGPAKPTTYRRCRKEKPILNQYQVGWDRKKDLPLIIWAESLYQAEKKYTMGKRAKAQRLEKDWLSHAHDVLDEMFPDADEEQKDIYACEEWQNALSDFENCSEFTEWAKKS